MGKKEQAQNALKRAATALKEDRLIDAGRWLTDAQSAIQSIRSAEHKDYVAKVVAADGVQK